MSVAGFMLIRRMQHLKKLNVVTTVSSFCVGLVSGIDKYPMLRSMTNANINPHIFRNILTIVGSGYSFQFSNLLSQKKIDDQSNSFVLFEDSKEW